MAPLPVDRCRGLALCGHRLYWHPDLLLLEGEDWDEELGKNFFVLMFFIYLIFFVIHACPDDGCMCVQMLAWSDQLVCPP